MSYLLQPEELWDAHGGALLALARTLLGDESAAERALSTGLTALYQDHCELKDPSALHVASRYVYAHCEAMRPHTCLVTFKGPRLINLNQRRMVALCIFGGYRYDDAAAMLGLTTDVAIRLLKSGLNHMRHQTH